MALPRPARAGGAVHAVAMVVAALVLGGAISVMTAPPFATATDPLPSLHPALAPSGGPRTLPPDLEPSLDAASSIRPSAYANGCHAKAGERRARACAHGPKDAPWSVLLIGDSHAVQWLPALEALATREGWRLYSLTKSACPVPSIPVIVHGRRLRDCEAWRERAFERVADIHPDLVIAASLGRIYELRGGGTPEHHERRWRDAWVRSLERLEAHAGRVVLLGDTPMWHEDPLVCLRRHEQDIDRCDTSRSEAISTSTEAVEREAAAKAGVAYVPSADLVCPDDPCRAVQGRYLVLGDVQHMTVAWALLIAPRLLGRLACPALVPVGSPEPPSETPDASARTGAPTPIPSTSHPGDVGPGAAPSDAPTAINCAP